MERQVVGYSSRNVVDDRRTSSVRRDTSPALNIARSSALGEVLQDISE